jgi:predicted AAA+ superfamily ATPase
LQEWKNSQNRKVLLVRGARQVGKTYSIRELGKSFEYCLEVNFDEEQSIHTIFEETSNPDVICENLSGFYGVPIIPGKTLLFFDEIQACVPAMKALRYFYEKLPDLHVIAAGSLLEFALKELPSFGVGRIRSIYMYPLSFNEFLIANGAESLLKLLKKGAPQIPLSEPIHKKLNNYLRKFLIIGGMPEVVHTYINTKDLNQCQAVLDDLINSYLDDFGKYKKRVPMMRVRDVFFSIAKQSGSKFIINKASGSANHLQIKDSLELLVLAGLAYRVNHASGNGIPIGAEANEKKFKMLMHDNGLQQRILNLDLREQLTHAEFNVVNKGSIAELAVGLELIKNTPPNIRPQLHYWHREAKSSNAEIDYLVQNQHEILPIEVKAGTKGQMQSMFLFLNEKKKEKGIRVSLENFSRYDRIDVYPLYAVSTILSK